MNSGGIRARAVRMALILLAIFIGPLLLGIVLDSRLGVWPWGILVALMLSIPAASIFIVRYTLNAYQQIEEKNLVSSTRTYTSVKEDERA